MSNFSKGLKKATVIQLLVGLKANHDNMQKSTRIGRSDASLEDIPIRDVSESALNYMTDCITELKRRVSAYKGHAQILEESS